jgi:excisionase family DNA binding protein
MSSAAPAVPVPLGEIGTSGLRHYSGLMQEEFDPKLRGRRAIEVYREMRDNSAILGASFQAIELTIRGVHWFVEAVSSGEDDAARAAFVEECLHDMSFSFADTVLEHMTMLQYGFAPCEIVYKRRQGYQDSGSASSRYDDGRIAWAKIALRGQETVSRWDLDANGGIRGFWQTPPSDWKERYIPIQKAVLFRVSRERNNPEGRSPLRSAYWDYYGAKRLTESMLIGAERDLAGFPVVRVPAKIMSPGASAEEKAVYEAYKTIARDTRRGDQEGLVLPSDRPEGGQHYHYDFQLLSTGGKREFNIAELVRDRTRMIAIVLLTDMLLMGHEKVGSFALADAKSSLFGAALDGYLQAIADVYNQHAIPRLLRLNGWPSAPAPVLKHKPLTPENLAALADFLQKMVASRVVTPDPELEQDIRKRADLKPRPDDVPPASGAPGAPPAPAGSPEPPSPSPEEDRGDGGAGGDQDASDASRLNEEEDAGAQEPAGPRCRQDLGQAASMPEPSHGPRPERLAAGQPPLRVSEVAAAIGFSPRYVRKLLENQAIQAVTSPSGRERRIPVEEVRRLIGELATSGSG